MRTWIATAMAAGLAIGLLLTSPGCEIFLGDDWGWEGYPCGADRHCQPGLSCFWLVGNPACVQQSTVDAFRCPDDSTCAQVFDSRFNCDDTFDPPTCGTGDNTEVVWCFDDQGDPSDALCKNQDQSWRCQDGICIQP